MANPKYIIGHWTAGNHKPNNKDLNSYQLLIDNEGKRHVGKPIGEAASTGGMNSITYNISCCGGLEHSPIMPTQFEAFCCTCAELIKDYDLSVNAFYTHAEIGEMCKNGSITKLLPYNKYLKQNIGKIDLTSLPGIKGSAKTTGDFIRNKIKWYLQQLTK